MGRPEQGIPEASRLMPPRRPRIVEPIPTTNPIDVTITRHSESDTVIPDSLRSVVSERARHFLKISADKKVIDEAHALARQDIIDLSTMLPGITTIEVPEGVVSIEPEERKVVYNASLIKRTVGEQVFNVIAKENVTFQFEMPPSGMQAPDGSLLKGKDIRKVIEQPLRARGFTANALQKLLSVKREIKIRESELRDHLSKRNQTLPEGARVIGDTRTRVVAREINVDSKLSYGQDASSEQESSSLPN